LLRPKALAAIGQPDLIIHAGDVGEAAILDRLRAIAPLVVVRGNVDRGAWAEGIPLTEVVHPQGVWIYVLHDATTLDLDPKAARFDVVISGHSHQPRLEWEGGILYLNPGSIGPRRFSLPVSMARLTIAEGRPHAELITLDV
jgi:hypothetical protein